MRSYFSKEVRRLPGGARPTGQQVQALCLTSLNLFLTPLSNARGCLLAAGVLAVHCEGGSAGPCAHTAVGEAVPSLCVKTGGRVL